MGKLIISLLNIADILMNGKPEEKEMIYKAMYGAGLTTEQMFETVNRLRKVMIGVKQ